MQIQQLISTALLHSGDGAIHHLGLTTQTVQLVQHAGRPCQAAGPGKRGEEKMI